MIQATAVPIAMTAPQPARYRVKETYFDGALRKRGTVVWLLPHEVGPRHDPVASWESTVQVQRDARVPPAQSAAQPSPAANARAPMPAPTEAAPLRVLPGGKQEAISDATRRAPITDSTTKCVASETRALATALRDWAGRLDGSALAGIVAEAARDTAAAGDMVADALHAGWSPGDALGRFGVARGWLWREYARSAGAAAGMRVGRRLLDAVREQTA